MTLRVLVFQKLRIAGSALELVRLCGMNLGHVGLQHLLSVYKAVEKLCAEHLISPGKANTRVCPSPPSAFPSHSLIFHSSSLTVLCWIIALNFDQRKLVHRRMCFYFDWKLMKTFHISHHLLLVSIHGWSRSVVPGNSAVTAGNALLLNLAFGISQKAGIWLKIAKRSLG